jgi:hypothetical protein
MNESQIKNASQREPARYGKVRFGIPGKRTVREPKWGNMGISCVMLDAVVPIPVLGLHVKSAIYANLIRKGDGTAEVEATAYLPGKVLGVDVEGANDLFLAHVETEAAKSPLYAEAYDAAAALLMGHEDPANAATPRAKVVRPKLGKPVAAPVAGRLVGKPAGKPQSDASAPAATPQPIA